ncbi:MAG TPA: phosphatase PAP2 family protein [Longimicrobium sp.]|nr:phosphatase PAP2 family protein [Longimicrobium sp.]
MSTDVRTPLARSPADARPGYWVVWEGMRLTGLRLRDGWRALPPAARRAWLLTMAIGLLACCALALLADVWVRGLERSGALAWEAEALRTLERRGPTFSMAIFLEPLGNALLLVPMLLGVASAAVWGGRPLRALSVVGAFFLADVAVGLGWLAWNRPRPGLIAGGIAAPGLHSFPSGHVAQAAASFGIVIYLWMVNTRSSLERVFAVLCWAGAVGLVALARLRMGAHWPSDVMAGVVIGLAWLAVSIAALRRAEALGGR